MSVPYVASLNQQLKRAFLKNDVNFHTKPGTKLGSLLCSRNKTRPDPFEQKGVYEQRCNCSPDAKYVGQTRVSFRTRMAQHSADVNSTKSDETIYPVFLYMPEIVPLGQLIGMNPTSSRH